MTNLPSLDKAIAGKTFSNSRGWTSKCASAHRDAAGKDRGYSYDGDEISDAYVKRQYNALVKNIADVEHNGEYKGVVSYAFTKPNGGYVVVDFLMD